MIELKLFIKQSIFLFVQFICLLCPNSLPVEQVQNNVSLQFSIQDNTKSCQLENSQQQKINDALLLAAGIDHKLSDWEWKAYLSANPSFKYSEHNQKAIQVVSTLLKNNHAYRKAHFKGEEGKFYALNEFPKNNKQYAVLVYGNELPAVAAAVMASRALARKGKVILLRENSPKAQFGGLLTQGGLSYLDRNQIDSSLTPSSAFYEEFLSRAKVKRISADPQLVDKALRQMLSEAGVVVVSGAQLKPKVEGNQIAYVEVKPASPLTNEALKSFTEVRRGNLKSHSRSFSLPLISGEDGQRPEGGIIKAHSYIDATQNADLARLANLKYSIGFETLGYPKATLPVSPIFTTEGLSIAQLKAIEKSIIDNPELMKQIKDKVTNDLNDTVDGIPPGPAFAKWLFNKIDKPMFVGSDFIDVRSIALGAAYHLHRNKPYDFKRGFLFDKANIAILRNGKLSWNTLLYKVSAEEAMKLVESGSRPTPQILDELEAFENWLHTFPQGKNAKVIAPEELYVRHSLNVLDVVKPLTGKEMLHGGTSPAQSVGTFSYYFDVRGGIEGMKGKMPKPIFNFGIEHALSKLSNLAVVSRSSGYYGLAPAVGRILELNVSVAAYVGLAAALSEQKQVPLNTITSSQAIQQWNRLTGVTPCAWHTCKIILSGRDLSGQVEDESRVI